MPEPLALARHVHEAAHCLRLAVLGIAVDFVTNEPAVLDAAAAAFGAWRNAPQDPSHGGAAAVRIHVDHASAQSAGGRIAHRVHAGRLVVSGRGCSGVTDPVRREAVARITADLLETATFRTEVLEALTWGLLTRLDRQPLHAAALATAGAALLIHGRSGAGKSTLALAAARAGMSAVADDIVFLQSRPRLRVWTAPGPLHVLPSAASALGVDASQAAVRVRDGTVKVAVEAHATDGRAFERCGLCLLGPRAQTARARRLSEAEALGLLDLRDPGFAAFADSIVPAIAGVVRNGAWLLQPSLSAAEAVPLLGAMLDDLAAAGGS